MLVLYITILCITHLYNYSYRLMYVALLAYYKVPTLYLYIWIQYFLAQGLLRQSRK